MNHMNYQLQNLEIILFKNNLQTFFFLFPSTFPFGTPTFFFSTIVKLVKPPIHSDWF